MIESMRRPNRPTIAKGFHPGNRAAIRAVPPAAVGPATQRFVDEVQLEVGAAMAGVADQGR